MGKTSKLSGKLDDSDMLRDEDISPRLGDMYADINDFAETKRKIEALIRLKKSLMGQKGADFAANPEELEQYKISVKDAIDRLFSAYIQSSKGE